MAVFPSFKLTEKGEELLNRSIGEGKTLTFTKFEIGNGDTPSDFRKQTGLVNKFYEFPILNTSIQKDQVLRIKGYFDNESFSEDKQLKEIGVYVRLDGIDIDYLYSYTNAGDTGDIIPASSRGFYSRTLDVANYIGYATNITFNIEQLRDRYAFNTENEMKVASYLKVGDKVELWGNLVLGDKPTDEYIIQESGDIELSNGLFAKKVSFKYITQTIEEMQGMALKVGDIVELLGYYQAGDGAGHKRVIASEDDGSGVQLGNGLWANIVHNGEINVSWFGAKGDGVTDDTEVIQKALDNSMIVKLDNKTYLTSVPLIVTKNQTLQGVSRGGTFIMFNPSSSLTYDIGTTEISLLPKETLKQINACVITAGYPAHTNIKIKDITLKTNTDENKGKYGLLIPHTVYSTFENLNIEAFEECFRVLQGWNNIITNVRVGGNAKYGFYFKDNKPTESLKTSWEFNKLYSDYCDIGFDFTNTTYSNANSIACDHAKQYCYRFSGCELVVNGMGAEMTDCQLIQSIDSTITINSFRPITITKGAIPPFSESDALIEINSSGKNYAGIIINGFSLGPNLYEIDRKLAYIKGVGQLIVNNAMLYKMYNYPQFIVDKIEKKSESSVVTINNFTNIEEINQIRSKKIQASYASGDNLKYFSPVFIWSNSRDSSNLKSIVKIDLNEFYKVFDISKADMYIRLPLKFFVVSGGSWVGNVFWINPSLVTSQAISNNLEITRISMTETTLDITFNKEIKNEVVYITLA